jgi:two-component system response regulator YesN
MRRSLGDVAKFVGLQPAYFSRRFRDLIGSSFAEWCAQLRISEAKRLLQVIDVPVIDVALAVGYSDPTTFARVFRRFERKSPRQYRRQLLELHSRRENTKNAEIGIANAEIG